VQRCGKFRPTTSGKAKEGDEWSLGWRGRDEARDSREGDCEIAVIDMDSKGPNAKYRVGRTRIDLSRPAMMEVKASHGARSSGDYTSVLYSVWAVKVSWMVGRVHCGRWGGGWSLSTEH
jgi:hypothetical protein